MYVCCFGQCALFCVPKCAHVRKNIIRKVSCLLDAEAEVEQAVGGVGLSIGPFQLPDEATEAVAQLSCGALKNVLL